MLLILGAFILEEVAKHERNESLSYNLLNLTGALLLATYAWRLQSVPFLILNAVWASVAAWKLWVLRTRRF